jgi:membrane-bound metal-dependent hydrolase YbcI (DUF457 family)
MPSPVGHILAGTAVYLAGTRRVPRSNLAIAITLLGSILPDFDFVPGILMGNLGAFHHGVSHSPAFAVLFGVLTVLFVRRQQKDVAWHVGILAALAYASHVLLDLVSVSEGARGVPILWPLSGERFGINLHLLGHFQYWPSYRGIWTVLRWDNVSVLCRELAVIGGLTMFLLWRERWIIRSRAAGRKRADKIRGATNE